MKHILCFWMILSSLAVSAQEYPISSISDSLRKNADAVVRYKENFFIQNDLNNGTYKVTEVVTVLAEDGKEYGHVVIYQDKFTELKSFTGVFTDNTGKVIKKIGKKDLTSTAYSSDIASDDKYSHYEYHPTGYPYTVRYEYELKIKNGIASYPRFIPVKGYRLSVEQAKHIIQVPSDKKVRFKANRLKQEEIRTEGKNTIYEWTITGFPAIESEPYAPALMFLAPTVELAPVDFCMEGICGNMLDWNNLGIWYMNLLKERDKISPALKEKIISLTANAVNEKEKVQRIFQYLQSTTRYVSIQLGIGGLQPMNASIVEKTGFGDCKALSNYMKAMLEVVNIPSIYTIISTDRASLYSDFASLGQMNHVILAVPMATDTLWLECTNPLIPFNYAHSNIAGHQCLLITPEGGKLARVKNQTSISNHKSTNVFISIDESGNASGKMNADHKLEAYEYMMGFVHNMSREEQVNAILRGLKSAKTQISGLEIISNDSETPDLKLQYQLKLEHFGNRSGNRLFVPLSLSPVYITPLRTTARKYDIVISNNVLRSDTLRIDIPKSFTGESIPKSITLDSEFGNYSMNIGINNNEILIIQQLLLKKGQYPANKAIEFQQFTKDIGKEVNRKMVF
ncbi:MAG: DUF3857 domain-containing transglutaminase family protein, partial [Bacteroidales bacterium]|nr:DUF3857 domain-containing transglutaminase family protein [Bacteroidales bacterium]